MPMSEFRLLCRQTVALAALLAVTGADAAPPIRSSETNRVPACVTPDRLMAFVADRNPTLDRRYAGLAEYYKRYGEAWQVRWDYAFYQMILETNYLSYRKGNGRRSDVWEDQNNFAGIGATGRGARGERFQDIETGVHAQIQHLVAYSGQHVEDPVARRTRENQDDIIAQSLRVRHPMTFGDLARRWATDRTYGKSIDIVAGLFLAKYCAEPAAQAADDTAVPAPQPVNRLQFWPFRPPSGLGGPKPDRLAGPSPDANDGDNEEVLPWLAEPVKRPPSNMTKPHQPAKTAKAPAKSGAPHRSPVKTIWSRGDANKPGPAEPTPAPVADDSPGRARNSVQKFTTTTDDPSAAATSEAVSADGKGTSLPTFRIAPLAVAASRLGGPLPDAATMAAPTANPGPCRILTASYGGTKTLLLRSSTGGEMRLTALTVLDGFEKSLFENYASAEAKGAEIIGEYDTADAALADAHANCADE